MSLREFERIDMRVGRVSEAQGIPGYSKILKLIVDVGRSKVQCIAGGAQYYGPDYFLGRRVIVLLNIEPRTVAGVKSEAMLLAAEGELSDKPHWLTVDEEAPLGAKVK